MNRGGTEGWAWLWPVMDLLVGWATTCTTCKPIRRVIWTFVTFVSLSHTHTHANSDAACNYRDSIFGLLQFSSYCLDTISFPWHKDPYFGCSKFTFKTWITSHLLFTPQDSYQHLLDMPCLMPFQNPILIYKMVAYFLYCFCLYIYFLCDFIPCTIFLHFQHYRFKEK